MDYRRALMTWVLDLKSKTNDAEFIGTMARAYDWLNKLVDDETFIPLSGGYDIKRALDNAYLEIQNKINEYNNRIEKNELIEREKASKIKEEEKKKNDPNNRFNKGLEEFKYSNYEGSINIMNSLILDGYSNAKIYFLRGSANFELKRNSLAFDDLKKADDLGLMDDMLYNNLGWLYRKRNDNLNSLLYFNKAIELQPENAYYYYSRGELFANTNRNNDAIKDYNKAIELNPNFSMAYNNLGWAKFEMKLYKQALIDLNKAIELDDKNWNAYDSRQEVKFAINDLDGCLEDCNKAIAINPKVANSYFFRGRVYFKKGDKKLAEENWNQAGNLGKELGFEYIKKYCK
jgi:tetratricopeptide (TPR) repeat protein